MKIADVEWLQVGRWFYVLVHTEEGITGLGEGGVHGYPEAIGGVLQAWKPYLLGQDPLRIEHHWQFLYRNSHVGGESPDALAADARRAVEQGFTAVRFTPFPRRYTSMRYAELLEEMLTRV